MKIKAEDIDLENANNALKDFLAMAKGIQNDTAELLREDYEKDARIAELEAALRPFVQAYNENEYFITPILSYNAWVTADKTLEGAE